MLWDRSDDTYLNHIAIFNYSCLDLHYDEFQVDGVVNDVGAAVLVTLLLFTYIMPLTIPVYYTNMHFR